VIADALDFRHHPVRPRLEHHHAADVHERALIELLELEEGGAEDSQPVGGHMPTVRLDSRS